MIWVYLALVASALALLLALFYARQVNNADPGNARMQELMDAIRAGAMAFIRREYIAVAAFVAVLATLILIFLDYGRPWGAIAYVFGAFLSALAGFIGMRIATAANARTTEAARTGGIKAALPLAFRGGAVMGFTVAGLGLFGLSIGYLVFVEWLEVDQAFSVLTAIALGGSTIALFSRVGGGIYTKAADVGADLVGKVEAGIPEDDPRNPATIADNVGDNVGDVAGMGADLFESYVGSMIAPIAFAAFAFTGFAFQEEAFFYPLMIATLGMGASIIGSFLVKPGKGSLAAALHRGTYAAMGLTIVGVAILTPVMFNGLEGVDNSWGLVVSVVTGLLVGWLIGQISEWYHQRPSQGREGNRPPVPDRSRHRGVGRHLRRDEVGGVLRSRCCRRYGRRLLGWRVGVRRATGRHLRHRGCRRRRALDPGDHRVGRCVRTHRRQRRRDRRDGGPATGGPRDHRRPGLARQHHRGRCQGLRHRCCRHHGVGAVLHFPAGSGRCRRGVGVTRHSRYLRDHRPLPRSRLPVSSLRR